MIFYLCTSLCCSQEAYYHHQYPSLPIFFALSQFSNILVFIEVVVCGIMFNFDQGFSCCLASVGIVTAYFLYTMIIWYIKKKPLGTTTPFDMVTIDTILIRLANITAFFILFLSSIIEGNTIPNSRKLVLTLPLYILSCLGLSSEILNSFFRILYLKKQQWFLEESDSKVRKVSWIVKTIITGMLHLLFRLYLEQTY